MKPQNFKNSNFKPQTLLVFPNCKINLGLNVIRKRDDGFHDLETTFFPFPFHDALELITWEDQHNSQPREHVMFRSSGIELSGNTEDNLCVKAYHLLKKQFPQLPQVTIHLHKSIPLGAGLGGGSADGAFTLRLINDKYALGLSTAELVQLAAELGSDCPFFIINKPCFATSRGEMLEEIQLDLSRYHIVLVNPGIHVDTSWAFSCIVPKEEHSDSLKALMLQPVTEWKDKVVNDFEIPVFDKHPEIKNIKDYLYASGAVYASMSGSGSTVFGIFETQPEVEFPDTYTVIQPRK